MQNCVALAAPATSRAACCAAAAAPAPDRRWHTHVQVKQQQGWHIVGGMWRRMQRSARHTPAQAPAQAADRTPWEQAKGKGPVQQQQQPEEGLSYRVRLWHPDADTPSIARIWQEVGGCTVCVLSPSLNASQAIAAVQHAWSLQRLSHQCTSPPVLSPPQSLLQAGLTSFGESRGGSSNSGGGHSSVRGSTADQQACEAAMQQLRRGHTRKQEAAARTRSLRQEGPEASAAGMQGRAVQAGRVSTSSSNSSQGAHRYHGQTKETPLQ